jgi:hypothetical protein
MARLGLPPETIRFLRELRGNDRNGWFDATGPTMSVVVMPANAFVVAAGELLAELVPGIRAEPGCWAPASASTRRRMATGA